MKQWMFVAAIALAATAAQGKDSHSVKPHFKKDGTYVEGHRQTNPDSNKTNNWSSKGNANPYTGKEGTKDPYAVPPPKPYNLLRSKH